MVPLSPPTPLHKEMLHKEIPIPKQCLTQLLSQLSPPIRPKQPRIQHVYLKIAVVTIMSMESEAEANILFDEAPNDPSSLRS